MGRRCCGLGGGGWGGRESAQGPGPRRQERLRRRQWRQMIAVRAAPARDRFERVRMVGRQSVRSGGMNSAMNEALRSGQNGGVSRSGEAD